MARISVSKLAEYMVAHPGRRRSILKDQKDPKAFKVAWYTQVTPVLVDYFVKRDPVVVEKAIDSWHRAKPTTDFHEAQLGLWIDTAEAFLRGSDDLDIDGLSFEPADREAPHLELAGVSISVRPELLVRDQDGGQGAWKLYFGKSHPLTESEGRETGSGSYAAAIAHHWADQNLRHPKQALSAVLDVIPGQLFRAPRATKRMFDRLEAACAEIAAVWPRIGPAS